MVEEKQISLDREILSLELEALIELAGHLKIDQSAVEGKGKLAVIRVIQRKIDEETESLSAEDSIDYLDELITHLGPPPLEELEEQAGDSGTGKSSELEQLHQELSNLEAQQQMIQQKLTSVQKDTSNHQEKEKPVISVPLVGVQQSILRRDFKIQGVVGDPGRKDKLGYQALISQIEAGLLKGYSDHKVVGDVIRAIQPGIQLRSYLENMTELTLAKLRKILRFHFHEKNATELYQLLTNIAQLPKEDPQSFLMRALTIRQKIISASKESGSGVKYDAASVQSLFLHALETGLADETIRAKIRPYTHNPSVPDEDLIEAMSMAMSAEAERSNKFSLTSKAKPPKVSAVERAAETEGKKEQNIFAVLKAVQADLAAVQSEVKLLREGTSAYSGNTMRQPQPGGKATTGNQGRPVGCRACREKKEGHECPHCYLCGGHNHIARHCYTKSNRQQGNGHRLPPRDRE